MSVTDHFPLHTTSRVGNSSKKTRDGARETYKTPSPFPLESAAPVAFELCTPAKPGWPTDRCLGETPEFDKPASIYIVRTLLYKVHVS